MKIRKYLKKDLPDIVRINVYCWKHNYKGNVDQAYLDSISYQKQLKKRSNKEIKGNIFVSEIDGKVVGFIHGGKSRDGEEFPPYEIRGLYIDPNHQGKGIGTKLFQFIIDLYSIKSFYLWTLKNNPQSEGFYQKMGGVKFGEKTREFGGYPIQEVGYKWK
ncbi:MAG TPA: GNAT family N-acetyltransferase [Candidatus Absconditabacterales bacterium]|nr:GNAT family N-acetyltransferase [Candidatus Absconditabacterales bacterium]